MTAIKPTSSAGGKELKPRWLAESRFASYIATMNWLTKQEQLIICLVIGLLVTGLAVKFYRAAHPAVTGSQPAKP